MLSIVLYGRNDNYGYNLHKRAALSLNCMAQILSDPDDEILFVDYNTPDDFPTFPEAIADTLTEKAKQHLRILRVRPSVHERFAARTQLKALEPVARNVAVRRSNPANRWILSTNTDMIFVPRREQTLTDIVRDLPEGYYGIPRFEVPETLWEMLDRRDPAAVIESVGRWGWELHLNEIVTTMKPFLFDGPGDFQLMMRSDLFSIHGFDENMLLGWHVDANIARRISMIRGDIGVLSDQVFGYHCDHTRQVTPMHRSNAAQNDYDRFFYLVKQPHLPEQAENWGCVGDEIEEVQISSLEKSSYHFALGTLRQSPLNVPLQSAYASDTYNSSGYVPEHVLPFLLDLFTSVPRHWKVAWLGAPGKMLSLFVEGLRTHGFAAPVWVHASVAKDLPSHLADLVTPSTFDDIASQADVFIFDISQGDGAPLALSSIQGRLLSRFLTEAFQILIDAEKSRLGEGAAPRRFVGINAIHNAFEGLWSEQVNCAKTPFSVRIRHGFLFKTEFGAQPRETIPLPGVLARFPYDKRHDFGAQISVDPIAEGIRLQPAEAGLLQEGGALQPVGAVGLLARSGPFSLPSGQYRIEVETAAVRPLEQKQNWLQPRLYKIIMQTRRLLGPRLERRVRRTGKRLLGRKLAGEFKAFLMRQVWPPRIQPSQLPFAIIEMDISAGDRQLARARVIGSEILNSPHILDFDVEAPPNGKMSNILFSIRTNGHGTFSVTGINIKRMAALPTEQQDDLPPDKQDVRQYREAVSI
ncbi:hypothetical protein [Brucella sp. IR073]|uniref:hypothetical protein n=1 Tax=unclassified Brucella TaxID=2632610 RepID=UPI003B97D7A6